MPSSATRNLTESRTELSIATKNGINFIMAAAICWALIGLIWLNPDSSKQAAFFTFFAVGPMMPLAWIFSMLLKTKWSVENNPLNSLGLWLNFSQLFYFPFIFIAFYKNPADMPMALAIITGAHFFPFAWYYKAKAYAVMAGIISAGSAVVGSLVSQQDIFMVPVFMTGMLTILAMLLYLDYKKKTSPKRHT
ncbi:MAG TPA: hypothetical protein VE870_11985 [Bacteroidales bacterium]|nr:hypothetical protein [Bacteroidales bacterium]